MIGYLEQQWMSCTKTLTDRGQRVAAQGARVRFTGAETESVNHMLRIKGLRDNFRVKVRLIRKL